jgi:tight adherence protein C
VIEALGRRIVRIFVDEKGETRQALRRKMVMAGIYAPDAPKTFTAARLVLLLTLALVGFLLSMVMASDWLLYTAMGGGIGFFGPVIWLRQKIKANHKALERGMPDGIDLLVVCVEAGLTIDAAMQRVGDELALAHPTFARELSICHMEGQIGLPRSTALRNLGERTGFAPLQALCAMLIQADRFGTSIANALRIQAESLRSKRQHRAEETAAKASVKLTFPLVLFIFPASFIIIAGPTILKMMRSGFFE